MVLDVRPNKAIANYYYMNDISSSGNGEYFEVAYACNNGEKCVELTTQSSNNGPTTPLAPFYPIDQLSVQELETPLLIGAFPNPFNRDFVVQLYLNSILPLTIEVIDNSGRICLQKELTNLVQGPNYIKIDMDGFNEGMYQVNILGSENRIVKRVIKF